MYKSISIVGSAKNAGKTECLNYMLQKLTARGKTVGVTSVGLDGESVDQVCGTKKPEVFLSAGTLFVTTEQDYAGRKLSAEVLDTAERRTPLGRVILCRALTGGKIILSGPSDVSSLTQASKMLACAGAEIILIDGAVSRVSHGSPIVSEAMIYSTGAALSKNLKKLVSQTKLFCDIASLPKEAIYDGKLFSKESGVWSIDLSGSLSAIEDLEYGQDGEPNKIYVAGAVTERILTEIERRAGFENTTIVARDFSRFFLLPQTFYRASKKGAEFKLLEKNELLGVTVNPSSPDGHNLNPDVLLAEMRKAISLPVIDVRRPDK